MQIFLSPQKLKRLTLSNRKCAQVKSKFSYGICMNSFFYIWCVSYATEIDKLRPPFFYKRLNNSLSFWVVKKGEIGYLFPSDFDSVANFQIQMSKIQTKIYYRRIALKRENSKFLPEFSSKIDETKKKKKKNQRGKMLRKKIDQDIRFY